MTKLAEQPELKRILGAMLFGAREPVSVADMRGVLARVAEERGASARESGQATEAKIRAALDQIKADLAERQVGLHMVEVAGGFRLETDAECGPWLWELLDIRKPPRLSRPALETLAIIAYRQPVTRPEIEAVRGVNVDSIVRNLLDIQVIRMLGRSDLPGRPMLYGTTQLFLEHFGLNDLKDLPGIDELSRRAQRIGEKRGERVGDRKALDEQVQEEQCEAKESRSDGEGGRS